LGGIYALERIADESERDHWPIMEVLCTYVRENARAPRKGEDPPIEAQKLANPVQDDQASNPVPHLAADIQSILTVLGRRNRKYERTQRYLELSRTDLSGALLYEGDLSLMDLRGANLSGADLRRVKFHRTALSEADLSRALLTEGDLYGAELSGANLSGTNLSRVDLRLTLGLTQEQVDSAIGDRATQLPPELNRPDTWGKRNFSLANLRGQDLRGQDLRGAKLHATDFSKADLRGANLSESDLTEANLTEANLSGAFLSGTDLRLTLGLTQEQVDSAIGNSATQLPGFLHRPEIWVEVEKLVGGPDGQ
jgi:uncharacterized protein YjbI with pentapeptide repeats